MEESGQLGSIWVFWEYGRHAVRILLLSLLESPFTQR